MKKIIVMTFTLLLVTGCTLFQPKDKVIDPESKLGKSLINVVKNAYSWIDYKIKKEFNTDELKIRIALDNVDKNNCYKYNDNNEEVYICNSIGKDIYQYVDKKVIDSKVKDIFNSDITSNKYIESNKYFIDCEDINTNSYFVYDDKEEKYVMKHQFDCAVANVAYGNIVYKNIVEKNNEYIVELKYIFIKDNDFIKDNAYKTAYYKDVEMNELLLGKKINDKQLSNDEYNKLVEDNLKKLWTYKYSFKKLNDDKFVLKTLEVKKPK